MNISTDKIAQNLNAYTDINKRIILTSDCASRAKSALTTDLAHISALNEFRSEIFRKNLPNNNFLHCDSM